MRFQHRPTGQKLLNEQDMHWFLKRYHKENPKADSYCVEKLGKEVRYIRYNAINDSFDERREKYDESEWRKWVRL